MGVHDYLCFIHTSGEQCLEMHQKCCGKSKYIDHEPEICKVKVGDQEFSEEYDSHDNDSGYGTGECICILFDLPDKIIDPKKALKMLKKRKAKNIRIRFDIEYSWDAWDFSDPPNDSAYMGYCDVLQNSDNVRDDMPWKVNNEHRDVPYKKLFWVIIVCPMCYKQFLTTLNKKPRNICSQYYHLLTEKFDDSFPKNKINTNRKRNAYNHVWKEYRWLRRLIRKYK